MGELTPIRAQALTPRLPERVQRLLAADEYDDERRSAGLQPLAKVEDRDELAAAIDAIKRSLQAAPREFIVAVLTRLAAHFPVQGRSEGQWRMIFEDLATDFREMPADLMEQAATEYRRTAKWWPRSSELLDLAIPKLRQRQRELARLERLAKPGKKAPDEATTEERQRVGRMLGELAAKVRSWGPGNEPWPEDAA